MANAGKTVIVAALDGTFQRKVNYFKFLIVFPGYFMPQIYKVSHGFIAGFWEHLTASPLSRECGETKCCLYGVLSWGLLYQKAGNRERGKTVVRALPFFKGSPSTCVRGVLVIGQEQQNVLLLNFLLTLLGGSDRRGGQVSLSLPGLLFQEPTTVGVWKQREPTRWE